MKTEIIQTIPDRMFVALKRWEWKGAFDSWEAAQLQSNGYNADNILQKVLAASLRVKEGSALFERDSVLFYENISLGVIGCVNVDRRSTRWFSEYH